ncbi:unnamed protein product [Pieris macdunnoughi]|uniref:Uncharacterized protein n=1 Tax=Pieris macdunnoughi TaxID=345717 RepID=A0A821PAG4_9NEOP|nr:unnamed protein product [Pieris macdunnoughi]
MINTTDSSELFNVNNIIIERRKLAKGLFDRADSSKHPQLQHSASSLKITPWPLTTGHDSPGRVPGYLSIAPRFTSPYNHDFCRLRAVNRALLPAFTEAYSPGTVPPCINRVRPHTPTEGGSTHSTIHDGNSTKNKTKALSIKPIPSIQIKIFVGQMDVVRF